MNLNHDRKTEILRCTTMISDNEIFSALMVQVCDTWDAALADLFSRSKILVGFLLSE